MSIHDDAVQVTFSPGGKRCHCLCPGARIGDTVKSPGWSGPATVVGFGSLSKYQPLRAAKIVRRADDSGFTYTKDHATMNTAVEQIEQQLKAAKKAEKRERKVIREAAAVAAERVRLRKVALDALEDVAINDTSGGARVAAATALHSLASR